MAVAIFSTHLALSLSVAQKRREPSAVESVDYYEEELVGEFKCSRELGHDLIDAVQPLQKHRASFMRRVLVDRATALVHHVTEAAPIFLDKGRKALDGSIKWVQQQLRQTAELRCSVPTVGAVH